MEKETIEELTTGEFNLLIDRFIAREDDRIEPSTFLKAMAELEAGRAIREVELSGSVVNGEIIFDTPAPLPVVGNTIYVGDLKMKFKLRIPGNEMTGSEPAEVV